jgi:hypothetical protein
LTGGGHRRRSSIVQMQFIFCVSSGQPSFACKLLTGGWELGADFSPARTLAANTGYPTKLRPEELLGEPARLVAFDFSQATADAFKAEVCVEAVRNGTLHGIGGWFSVQLSPGVVMTNSPLAKDAINRRQISPPSTSR